MEMTFQHQPHGVKAAAAHLLDSAMKTKGEGDPLDLIARKFGDHTAEVMKRLGATDEQLEANRKKMAELDAMVLDVVQKAARSPGPSGDLFAPASLGKQFVESDRYKSFLADGKDSAHGKVDLRVKATLTSLTTDAAGSVGAAAVPAHRDGIVLLPQRRLRIRDLVPVININAGSVEFPKMKARTNAAAMVAEGAAKPESDMQFEMKTAAARVIAHHVKASRQILEDAPQLLGTIDSELVYGLGLVEEAQLLAGDGTGQNLLGMIPQATAYAAPTTPEGINLIDVLGLAALQAALAEYQADGVILHPADWLEMRMLKNSAGDYIFGPPNSPIAPRVFDLPVVATQAMTVRKFLVGQFQVAATIYDRWEARVELGYVNDDFTKNLVTILGEERLAFAVKQPAALIYGDFDTALAA